MDSPSYLRFVLALIAVLGLLYGCLWLLQKLAPRMAGWKSTAGARRLGIIETLVIDPRRRLVLIQRDNKQHLILCGAGQDLVIETNIIPPSFESFPHDPGQP